MKLLLRKSLRSKCIDYRTILLCIIVCIAFTAILHRSEDAPRYSKSFGVYSFKCPAQIYADLGYNCDDKYIYPVGPVETSMASRFYAARVRMAIKLNNKEEDKDRSKDNPADRLKAKLPTDVVELKLSMEITIARVNPSNSFDYEIDQRKVQQEMTFIYYLDNPQFPACPYQTIAQIDMPVDLNDLNGKQYIFILKWVDPLDLAWIIFEVLYGGEDFALYLSNFKAILSIFAFLAWINYVPYLVKTNNDLLSYERKCVAVLGFLLIAYTQTLSEHMFPLNNLMLLEVSAITISAISALITMLWLLLIERLASKDNVVPDRSRLLINLIALAHFIVSLTVYCRLENQLYKEYASLRAEYKGEGFHKFIWYIFIFQDLGIIVFVTIITILWTLMRLITILWKYCKLEWKDRTIFSYSLIFTVLHIFLIASGNLRVDNNKEGFIVMMVYGTISLYTILLLILYIPSDSDIAASAKKSFRLWGQYDELDMKDDTSTETDVRKAIIELGRTNYAERDPDQSEETF